MLGFVLMGQVALAQTPPVNKPPFVFERYTSAGHLNELTTYSTTDYYAAIIGFKALNGDIHEAITADIIKVYAEADSTGFWRIQADFISHINDEGWEVEVMFIDKRFANGEVIQGDGFNTDVDGQVLKFKGHDFILGTDDGRPIGSKTDQRALVHAFSDELVINFDGDFEGGVRVWSDMRVTGDLSLDNDITANGNNIAQVRKYSSANPAIPAEFTSMGKSGSNNAIKKNYYGFSARTDTAALNMAVNGNEAVIDYAAHEFGIYSSANGQNPKERLRIYDRFTDIISDELRFKGFDFIMGQNDGREQGSIPNQRALVHSQTGDTLLINFNGDFEGGVEVQSNVSITGKLFVNGNEVTGASGARVAQDPEALAQMMQELEDLRQQNQALEARLAAIEKSMLGQQPTDALQIPAARLAQNYPNPFTQRTTINYELPANTQQATLYVFDMSGQQKMVFNNLSAGKGQTTINANTLQPGMYIYSLVVNGKVLDTKRMLLTK